MVVTKNNDKVIQALGSLNEFFEFVDDNDVDSVLFNFIFNLLYYLRLNERYAVAFVVLINFKPAGADSYRAIRFFR